MPTPQSQVSGPHTSDPLTLPCPRPSPACPPSCCVSAGARRQLHRVLPLPLLSRRAHGGHARGTPAMPLTPRQRSPEAGGTGRSVPLPEPGGQSGRLAPRLLSPLTCTGLALPEGTATKDGDSPRHSLSERTPAVTSVGCAAGGCVSQETLVHPVRWDASGRAHRAGSRGPARTSAAQGKSHPVGRGGELVCHQPGLTGVSPP